jgi:hypothetical protein
VREALGAFAAPAVRDEMIALALSIASVPDVPDDVEECQRFVSGVLRTVVSGYLGEDVADAVAADLAPMLLLLTSQVRPATREERELSEQQNMRGEITQVRRTPTPLPRPAAAVVLLATLNAERVSSLGKGLDGVAAVRVAEHVFALAAALDARPHRLPLVVIDLDAAPFDAAGLGALAPLLPTGTRMVLWGDQARFSKAIERLRRGGIEFVTCNPGATMDDVVALCRAFVA